MCVKKLSVFLISALRIPIHTGIHSETMLITLLETYEKGYAVMCLGITRGYFELFNPIIPLEQSPYQISIAEKSSFDSISSFAYILPTSHKANFTLNLLP